MYQTWRWQAPGTNRLPLERLRQQLPKPYRSLLSCLLETSPAAWVITAEPITDKIVRKYFPYAIPHQTA